MAWLFCFGFLWLGCSSERDARDLLAPGQTGVIVVEAQLIVGKSMPTIRLQTTQSPAEPFNRLEAGMELATVLVFVSTGDTICYTANPATRGEYVPEGILTGTAPAVLPRTTYSLRVAAPDGRIVTAETTTPDAFQVDEWLLLDDPTLAVRRRLAARTDFSVDPESVYVVDTNQLVYQDGLLEARFDRANAIAFQVGLLSRDAGSPYVIDADFLSNTELARLERETSSPPLDAAESLVRLPWLAIFFEGRYDLRIYSVDRNWYDLARSIQFLSNSNFGFGSTAGDSSERPIFHVIGGIGLFGSASMDETGFTIHPRP